MNHKCPWPDCPRSVGPDQLACRPHWFGLPKAFRAAIWAAWDNGRGKGTPAHTAAIAAALRWYDNHIPAGKPSPRRH